MLFTLSIKISQAPEHAVEVRSTNGTALWVEGTGGTENNDYGIRSEDDDSDGVFGWSHGTGNTDTGVTGRSEDSYGIYVFTTSAGQYGGYFEDPIYVNGGCTGCTMSYVAQNVSEQPLSPGDTARAVGVDAGLATRSPVIQVMSATPEHAVLGVVLGRVEMEMTEGSDDKKPGFHFGPVGGDAQPDDYLVVGVQGLAKVRVDSEARFQAGDLAHIDASSVTKDGYEASIGMAVDQPDADGMAWVLVGFH